MCRSLMPRRHACQNIVDSTTFSNRLQLSDKMSVFAATAKPCQRARCKSLHESAARGQVRLVRARVVLQHWADSTERSRAFGNCHRRCNNSIDHPRRTYSTDMSPATRSLFDLPSGEPLQASPGDARPKWSRSATASLRWCIVTLSLSWKHRFWHSNFRRHVASDCAVWARSTAGGLVPARGGSEHGGWRCVAAICDVSGRAGLGRLV